MKRGVDPVIRFRGALLVAAALSQLVACGGGGSSSAPPAANRPPSMSPQSFTMDEDGSLIRQLVASDADGESLSFVVTSPPTRGSLTDFASNGSFTYRPNTDVNGVDTFTVSVSDPRGGSATAQITVNVTSVNDAPRPQALTLSAQEDTSSHAVVQANDPENDSFTIAVTSNPSHGSLTAFDANTGSFTYAPSPRFNGADSFVVGFTDAGNASSQLTVQITVDGENDSPVATNDRATFAASAPLVLDVTANDVDPDDDTLTVTIETQPLVGTATVVGESVHLGGLPASFRGMTRFRYRVTDAAGASSSAMAVVFIDTAAFRAIYMRDVGAGGIGIALSDFTADDGRLIEVDDSGGRLVRGFVPARNGSVVASVVANPADLTGSERICVSATAVGGQSNCMAPPPGTSVLVRAGSPMISVSPNGRWIAVCVGRLDLAADQSLYLIDTQQPLALIPVAITDTDDHRTVALAPIFSPDSSYLYFIATYRPDLTFGNLVFRVALSDPTTAIRMSPITSGLHWVGQLMISSDNSRIILQRDHPAEGFWRIDTANPGIETRVTPWPDVTPLFLSAPPTVFDGSLIAYNYAFAERSVFVSELTGAANARKVFEYPDAATGPIRIRPDGKALLVRQTAGTGTELIEVPIDTPAAPARVGDGYVGYYDATGDHIFLRQQASIALGPPERSFIGSRASPGVVTPVGGSSDYTFGHSDAQDVSRGALIVGLTAESVKLPSQTTPNLVNFAAPGQTLSLSTRPLTTDASTLQGARQYLVDGAP